MAVEAELGPTTRVMHAVELLWAEIRRRHPDVPEAVLVLASGTMGTSAEIYGHFARSRWFVGEGREPRAEFFLGAEGLRRPATEILGTTLHEAAHGLAVTRDIVDVSDGRYHNKKFASLAIEMGVQVSQLDRSGWSKTNVPAETVAKYQSELTVLEAALTVWRHTETEVVQRALTGPPLPADPADPQDPEVEPVPPRIMLGAVDGRGAHSGGGNYIPVVCGCAKPRRFRIARSVLDLGGITCDVCDSPFQETNRDSSG